MQAAGYEERHVWGGLPGLRLGGGGGGGGISSRPALPCQLLPPRAAVGPGPWAGGLLRIVTVTRGS